MRPLTSVFKLPVSFPGNQGHQEELTRRVTPSFHTVQLQTEDLALPSDPSEVSGAHLLLKGVSSFPAGLYVDSLLGPSTSCQAQVTLL